MLHNSTMAAKTHASELMILAASAGFQDAGPDRWAEALVIDRPCRPPIDSLRVVAAAENTSASAAAATASAYPG